MYTLEDLKKKSLTELKEIGWELNVLPDDDRRKRQSWIDALVNVNPPLLQLLEVSPAASVEQVQEAIESVAKTSPAVEVEQVQEAVSQVVKSPPCAEVDQTQDIINQTWTSWEKEHCAWLKNARWCIHQGENKRIDAFLPVSKTLRLEGMKKGSEYCFLWEVSECTYDFNGLPLPACSSIDEQGSIAEATENFPGVEVQAQEPPLESKFDRIVYPHQAQREIAQAVKNTPGVEVERGQKAAAIELLSKKNLAELEEIAWCANVLPQGDPQCRQSWIDALVAKNINLFALQYLCRRYTQEVQRPELIEVQAQEPIVEMAENAPGGKVVKVKKPSGSKTHKTDTDRFRAASAGLHHSRIDTTESDASSKTFQAEVDRCQICNQLLAIPGDSERDWWSALFHQSTELVNSDLNPILTGISLSDKSLDRYAPPQVEIIRFKSDADGQLSLIDFEVESVDEPPDPDDFESLDAFRDAISRWDAQNPEPLAVSMDSMCEWAPCPEDWYEPKAEILPLKASSMIELSEQSEVMELLRADESSDTLNFFIPTFDRGDRPDGDEPPDTGIFARLPKPKPPTFPPQASQPKSGQVSPSQPKSARYPETIPKLFRCIVAGASNQPARSPPGGDAA